MNTTLESKYGAPSESLLGFADETVDELRERLLAAMRYTWSWRTAVDGSDNEDEWFARIADMQSRLTATLQAMPPADIFPRESAAKLYEETSAAWAALWRDLQLSADTLPRPDLLTVLGNYGKAVVDAPFVAAQTLVEQIANALGKALGKSAAAVWSALWPFLLAGGAIGVVYVFRAPLGRALGKVAK